VTYILKFIFDGLETREYSLSVYIHNAISVPSFLLHPNSPPVERMCDISYTLSAEESKPKRITKLPCRKQEESFIPTFLSIFVVRSVDNPFADDIVK